MLKAAGNFRAGCSRRLCPNRPVSRSSTRYRIRRFLSVRLFRSDHPTNTHRVGRKPHLSSRYLQEIHVRVFLRFRCYSSTFASHTMKSCLELNKKLSYRQQLAHLHYIRVMNTTPVSFKVLSRTDLYEPSCEIRYLQKANCRRQAARRAMPLKILLSD